MRELRNKKDLEKTEIWSAKGAKSSFGMGKKCISAVLVIGKNVGKGEKKEKRRRRNGETRERNGLTERWRKETK